MKFAPRDRFSRLDQGVGHSGPRHFPWGCVVIHLFEIEKLYDQIPEGTMVVIR